MLANEKFSITYKDDSGTIIPQMAKQLEATSIDSKESGIADVKTHEVDAFFYYPEDLANNSVEVYGKDSGLFTNGKYSAVAESLLNTSASEKIGSPDLLAIAKGHISIDTTTYTEDGEEAAGWMGAIPPMIFLVLLYLIVLLLGNNLLNSTIEEKENRVTEMILTTLNPTNLIVGKLVATFLAGFVQICVLVLPIILAYLLLGSDASIANLPDLDIVNSLVFDPLTMTIGFLIFIGGMMLFTGTLVAIGAIMPTAKEAGQYFGLAIALMFVPFYVLPLILSDPTSMVVKAFTYFPFTAPITAMLQNAFGSLSTTDAIIVIVELIILGVIIINVSVRLFRYGAMEYSNKLSLSNIIKRSK